MKISRMKIFVLMYSEILGRLTRPTECMAPAAVITAHTLQHIELTSPHDTKSRKPNMWWLACHRVCTVMSSKYPLSKCYTASYTSHLLPKNRKLAFYWVESSVPLLKPLITILSHNICFRALPQVNIQMWFLYRSQFLEDLQCKDIGERSRLIIKANLKQCTKIHYYIKIKSN